VKGNRTYLDMPSAAGLANVATLTARGWDMLVSS